MSEIVKSEYNALGEDNNYKTHYFKTSVDQVVGLGRLKSFSYAVGDVVYTDNNLSVALKCTTAGTTSNTELDVSTIAVGESVEDGSVVWKIVKRSNVFDEVDALPVVDGVAFDGSASITHYTTCSTDADTADKTVSIAGFSLVTGASVKVKFDNANTASSPTLNVNSTGARPIMYRGNAPIATLSNYHIYEFVYDGTYWRLVSGELTMVGATSSAGGKGGLVPLPSAGKQASFLRGDGTWAELSNTVSQKHNSTFKVTTTTVTKTVSGLTANKPVYYSLKNNTGYYAYVGVISGAKLTCASHMISTLGTQCGEKTAEHNVVIPTGTSLTFGIQGSNSSTISVTLQVYQ